VGKLHARHGDLHADRRREAETYTPSPADVGRSIRVSVTAANVVAPGAVAASVETAPIVAAPTIP
jgi:hypothetical protein